MIVFTWLLLLTSSQKEQLFDVFLSAFLPQGRSDINQLSEYFHNKISPRLEQGHFINTAWDNDRIVGFVIFQTWTGQNYYLAEMAVLPEDQRQGIGKELAFSIFEKDQNTKKILLVTEKGNRWSQVFYEKIGFQNSSFRHPDYPDNFIAYEFHRLPRK